MEWGRIVGRFVACARGVAGLRHGQQRHGQQRRRRLHGRRARCARGRRFAACACAHMNRSGGRSSGAAERRSLRMYGKIPTESISPTAHALRAAQPMTVRRSDGPVVRWPGGPVVRWSDRWSDGLVVWWSDGPMVWPSGSAPTGPPWGPYGTPMGPLWDPYGTPMGPLRDPYGTPMERTRGRRIGLRA